MHLWNQVVVDIDIALCIVLINVVLELGETQHIAVLVVSIILSMLLNSVVCQVNESIIDVLQVYAKL